MKYNQDAHTAQTIKQTKKFITSGQIEKAVKYTQKQIELCENKAGAEMSKAFRTDVLFAIKYL